MNYSSQDVRFSFSHNNNSTTTTTSVNHNNNKNNNPLQDKSGLWEPMLTKWLIDRKAWFLEES